jgi:hypothetical protein
MESKLGQQLYTPRLRYGMSMDEKKMFKDNLLNCDMKLQLYRKRIQHTESDFIPALLSDVMNGYSPIIVVCGRPRTGKSKFGLFLSTLCSVFLYAKWFKYKGNVFFFPRNLLKSISDDGYEIKMQDESGKDLNKRKYISELTFAFDQIVQTQGLLVNIYIFVLPFASDLVKDLRKYVDYICHVHKRGRVKIKKVYKKEDQLVSELRAFKQVTIEELIFTNSDVPADLWHEFETKSFEIKKRIRQKITAGLGKEDDWLEAYEGV